MIYLIPTRFVAPIDCLKIPAQSAQLFLKSLALGLPQPLTRRRECPPPPGFGGKGTLAGERGVGRVPIPTRGHIGKERNVVWADIQRRGSILAWIIILSVYGTSQVIDLSLSALIS